MQHLKNLLRSSKSEKREKSATATTAASGGNREELLGQRPARMRAAAKQTLGAATRLSEAASFFPFRPLHRDYQGRAALDSCLPVLAALNTRHLLRKPDCRLKSPTGAFMASPPPSLSKRRFSGSLLARKRELIPVTNIAPASACYPPQNPAASASASSTLARRRGSPSGI